ncbi:MAG: hypothetical protein V1922_00295 [bacterium]
MNKQSPPINKKSFTLVELVVYVGILSLLLIIFIDMFALLVNKQLETESLSSVQQDALYLLSRFSYDFGRAKDISFPSSPGTPSASLRLLIDSASYDYYATSSGIVATSSGYINQLNSADTTISNLSFQRLGVGNSKDVVQIKLDISSRAKKQSGYEVTHFSTTLGIREK